MSADRKWAWARVSPQQRKHLERQATRAQTWRKANAKRWGAA